MTAISFVSADHLDDGDDDGGDKMYGVVVGDVVDLADPMHLGRVQVRAKGIDAMDVLPWARIAVPMAGILHGTYFVPSVGDEVLLAFEHGDLQAPFVIGSVHNALHPPPLASPLSQIRAIRTPAGNQIVLSELAETVAIQTGPTPPETLPAPPIGPYQSIMLSPAGIHVTSPTSITFQVGESTITITDAGITLSAPTVSLLGTDVGLLAAIVEIKGRLMVRINS